MHGFYTGVAGCNSDSNLAFGRTSMGQGFWKARRVIMGTPFAEVAGA
jgi:hypothetical protein